jgi:hypothetical protein
VIVKSWAEAVCVMEREIKRQILNRRPINPFFGEGVSKEIFILF